MIWWYGDMIICWLYDYDWWDTHGAYAQALWGTGRTSRRWQAGTMTPSSPVQPTSIASCCLYYLSLENYWVLPISYVYHGVYTYGLFTYNGDLETVHDWYLPTFSMRALPIVCLYNIYLYVHLFISLRIRASGGAGEPEWPRYDPRRR